MAPDDRGYPASGRPSKSSADKTAFEEKKPGPGLAKPAPKKGWAQKLKDRWKTPGSGISGGQGGRQYPKVED